MTFTEEEVNYDIIKNSKVFHFGSVSMTDEPSRTATLKSAAFAKKQNKIISYDPNLRLPLWSNREEAKKQVIAGLEFPHILKISEEELEFITETSDLGEGTSLLADRYGIKVIFVTLGSEGCFYRAGGLINKIQGFKVETIDTTGAGDAFLGAAIHKILDIGKSLKDLSKEELDKIVCFANGAGAQVTTKRGAISVMPSLVDIERLLENKKFVY
jgi:fructokinase